MSINSLLGFILGFSLFLSAIWIAGGNFWLFASGSSVLMVVGGTLAATLVGQEARYVWLALKSIGSTLAVQRVGRGVLNREVGRIIRWGYLVQQRGYPALESEVKKVERDEFLRFGVELVVTGYEGSIVEDILFNVAQTTYERNMVQANILKAMAQTAPAFGMIGTLVGLIIMLDGMGGDPTQLGKGLAVALNTTLYGVLFSRLILTPASTKITQRQEILRFRHELVASGFALLADKQNPRHIQDRMNSYLDPAIRFDIDQQLRRGSGGREAA